MRTKMIDNNSSTNRNEIAKPKIDKQETGEETATTKSKPLNIV